jgi:hypothetical protein
VFLQEIYSLAFALREHGWWLRGQARADAGKRDRPADIRSDTASSAKSLPIEPNRKFYTTKTVNDLVIRQINDLAKTC